jgi:hypothetical protein
MKIISPVFIISALRLFILNKEKYLESVSVLDETKADINKPIFVYSNGEIYEGLETLKYVLESNSFVNVYYQIIER